MKAVQPSPRNRWQISLFRLCLVVLSVCFVLGLFGFGLDRWRQEDLRRDQFRRIGYAFQTYHDHFNAFPPAFIADASGTPMHSWRVLILPYLDDARAARIYARYDFSKPWNSAENMALADEIPRVYQNPYRNDSKSFDTHVMVIRGPGTLFPDDQQIRFADITDGAAHTILVVEVAKTQTCWLEPKDLDVQTMSTRIHDPRAPGRGISSPRRGGAYVVTADAFVHRLRTSELAVRLKRLITRNDGHPTWIEDGMIRTDER